MTEKNLFQTAAKKRYRFPSVVGFLTVEDLYDLPLTVAPSREAKAASLDNVARGIHIELKASEAESFVGIKSSGTTELTERLEIVKIIIADKQAAAEEAQNRAILRDKKQRIKDALAFAENRELDNKTVEELKAMLNDLGE